MNIHPLIFQPGSLPLLVSFPHNGAEFPAGLETGLTEAGKSSRDTDWFLDRLYDFPELAEASRILGKWSRYVIDLNRPADGGSLYPGQTTTGLVPNECFDGSPVRTGLLSELQIAERVEDYWRPYHRQLQLELERIRDRHGIAVLFDAHSIASEVPRLFDGRLPDFNLGTNRGDSCDSALTEALVAELAKQPGFSHVVNGRFVGGFITRHYGNPAAGIHAVQLELSQATYLDEANRQWDPEKVALVQPVLRQLIRAVIRWAESRIP